MGLYRFNKKKNEWDKIPKEQKQEGDLYLRESMIKCLNHYKEEQRKDSDVVIPITGSEGSGKSTMAGNLMEYVSDGMFDPKTDLIGSDYLDGLQKIENAKKGGWLMFDEGNAFFLSTETMNREHRDLHKIFSIFRQKNLFVIICMPSFFRLGSYFAIDRAIGLIRTYKKKSERGFYAFYGRKGKDLLYRIGKATYDDNIVRPNHRGRFAKCWKLETPAYKEFKRETLKREIAKAREKYAKKNGGEGNLTPGTSKELVRNNMDKPGRELARMLKVSERRIGQIKQDIRAESSKK